MSNSTSELSHPHLSLVREDRTPERKKRPGYPGNPPDRGGRGIYAPQLETASLRILQERQAKPVIPGIQPHLVFRVPLVEGASIDQIIDSLRDQAGFEIVSVEPDRAVIAFRGDLELKEFEKTVAIYKNGPRKGINPRTGKPFTTTKADFLEFIEPEKMRLWNRVDRIGDRLGKQIFEDGSKIDRSNKYIIDLELWHPGGAEGARKALEDLNIFVGTDQKNGERVLDTFSGQFIVLAKVAVLGDKLDKLLELDIIAEAELPPLPVFDPIQAFHVTSRDFPTPPRPAENGPRLCIVDSGITSNHPLLANNVGHEEAILTLTSSPADGNGHGTMVGGLAVFGDVRSCYESGVFNSPIVLYSARVLNDRNEFDDEKLIVNQMREAIEVFSQPPYDCRIFNLSLGSQMPAFDSIRPRQTLWGEELDVLARELKVLLIVSAGNHRASQANHSNEAENVLQSYC